MSLTRQETRSLRKIERSLRREDPRLAARLAAARSALLAASPADRTAERRAEMASLALVVGLLLLALGAIVSGAAVQAVGWLVILFVSLPLWAHLAAQRWLLHTPRRDP